MAAVFSVEEHVRWGDVDAAGLRARSGQEHHREEHEAAGRLDLAPRAFACYGEVFMARVRRAFPQGLRQLAERRYPWLLGQLQLRLAACLDSVGEQGNEHVVLEEAINLAKLADYRGLRLQALACAAARLLNRAQLNASSVAVTRSALRRSQLRHFRSLGAMFSMQMISYFL